MSYIETSLAKNETIHEIYRLHWFSKVPMYLCIATGFIAVFPFFLALYEWLRLRYLEQGATNKRVVLKYGIISIQTEEMKLDSIETIEINQGIIGRIFGFGDIKITGRGISKLILQNVENPLAVKKSIESINFA